MIKGQGITDPMATATKTRRVSPSKKRSAHRGTGPQNGLQRWWHYARALGPGLVTGAADDDPSGIATYVQTGAQFGYAQLWTALFALPLLTAVQEASARIGAVTGKGLALVVRERYGIKPVYAMVGLLVLTN